MRWLVSFLVLVFAAPAQVAREANSRYQTPEGRQRVAARLSAPDRVTRDKPEELVRTLAIRAGSTVADVGTGVGFLLPYLSAAVGPQGKVIAEDIFGDFLDQARTLARERELSNVTFVQGTETDPRLPAASVDLAIVLDAYHHYDYPERMLAGIRSALRKGGRLAIVDMYPDARSAAGQGHVRAGQEEVAREVQQSGLRLLSMSDHIPKSRYLLIFALPE
jgi:ubiquinone/menaquinone biosynthesis C-methylase UbiE